MKRWFKRVIPPVAVGIAVLGWIIYFHNPFVAAHLPKWGWAQAAVKHLGQSSAEAPTEDEDPDNTKNDIPIHTARVSVETLHRYVEAFGVVAPRPTRAGSMAGAANLASPVPGVVAKVLCQLGQKVKAGDIVIQLDDRVARAAEDQAGAAVTQAQASLAALKAQPRPDQVKLAQLGVDKAQGALDFAQRNYDRLKQIAADQGTSAKSVEQAGLDLSTAKTDLAVNRNQVEVLKNTPTPEDLRQEQAKVAQADAALASARVVRQATSIVSPVDATVVTLGVNPGEAVDVTRSLAQLIALDRLDVDLDVAADQLPDKTEGLEAHVFLAGTPADAPALTAKVSFVSPQVDAKTGAVMVSIELPAESKLRPGLAVRVRLVVDTHKDCLAVPRAAVVADENGDSVIALVEGDQATHKAVKAGIEENGLIEIIADGLKAGDAVATAGAYGLPQASRVKVLD